MSRSLEDAPHTNGKRSGTVPVISLFSGAGGLDLGVADAGGDIRVCLEPDADCVATLTANRNHLPDAAVLDAPIEYTSSEEILEAARVRRGEATLVVGGPPCQPFSKAGYWLKDSRQGVEDGRATNLVEYLRVVRDARPEAFILENVASLIHPGHRDGFDWFVWRARRLGYSVDWRLLNAIEFGVPQGRARVFVIGLRGKVPPTFPSATHWWHPKTRKDRVGKRSPETAGRWLARLDNPKFMEPEEVVTGRWAEHLHAVPPGANYKHLTAWAGHQSPSFVTETKYWSFLLKLSPFRPAWTIQATPGPWTGPFHWNSRRLRTQELAALQTFPRDYVIAGNRRSRMRQIGNAVPSLLASHVARAVLADVLGQPVERGRVLRYRLASGFKFDERLLTHSGHRW